MAQSSVQPVGRSVVIGLDFGTHGSGFAYKFVSAAADGSAPRQCDTWPGQPEELRNPKTRSALSYVGRKCVAWGWPALTAADGHRDGGEVPCCVEKFKLAICEAEGYNRPQGLNAVQVVAEYLGEMRRYIMAHLRQNAGAVHPDQVQWCLTVPAMWTDAAKDKMRRAALQAGLITKADSDALTLILEPEAAALCASRTGRDIKSGDISDMLVLDAGGGTVDATLHHATQQAGQIFLAEAAVGAGSLCGSTFIDERWQRHCRAEVGAAAYDAWRRSYPGEVQWMHTKWELVKCAFNPTPGATTARPLSGIIAGLHSVGLGGSGSGGGGAEVPIGPRLMQCMRDHRTYETFRGVQGGVADRVLLPAATMRQLFDPVVEDLLKLAREQVQRGWDTGHVCNKVLLVGGFAESAYLQQRARQAMGGVQVVVPPHPRAAVVQGAVLYGLQPDLITSRRSRMCYGVRTEAPLAAVPREVANSAVETFVHDEDNQTYMRDVFTRFVDRGQLVPVDHQVHHYAMPLFRHQTECILDLYATDDATLGCTSHNNMRKLQFGRTEITLTARDMQTDRQIAATATFAHSAKTRA